MVIARPRTCFLVSKRLLFFLLCSCAVSVESQCAPFDTSKSYYFVARHSGKALRLTNPTLGSTIEQQSLENIGLERWSLQSVGDINDNHYAIANQVTNLFLSVDTTTRGELIRQDSRSSTTYENWCFKPKAGGYYNLVNQASGLTIDIGGNSQADGAKALQWTLYNFAQNQDFSIIPSSTTTAQPTTAPSISQHPSVATESPTDSSLCTTFGDTSQKFYNLIARHSGKALHPMTRDTEALTVQFTLTGFTTGSGWMLEPAGNKHYKIINEYSGFRLSVSTSNPGEPIRQRNANVVDQTMENWCFIVDDSTGYYNIVNEFSGHTMDIAAARLTEAARLDQWYIRNTDNQDFELVETTPQQTSPEEGGQWSPVISSPLVPVAGGNLADGRVVLWSAYSRYDFGGANGQTWTALFDPTDGIFTEALVQDTNHDMFCPGTAVLSDTRILITGGSNARATTLFDPRVGSQGEWTQGADLNIARGYHSMTV